MGQEVAIRCTGLVKRFKDVVAVDGLDLEIYRGECFGLLGPNGAGKTTTVEILEGLIQPYGGEVEVLGRTWGGRGTRKLRAKLGVALQETRLPEKLKVFETLRVFRSFYKHGRSAKEVMALLGLTEKANARVGKLSGGQKQRLALACSLVGNPELLFLDEPTTGLDPQARHRIWEMVDKFKEDGGTVLLTTHYMDEAEHLCDRVAVVDRGKAIALGSPDSLVESLGASQVVRFRTENGVKLSGLADLPGVQGADRHGDIVMLRVQEIQHSFPAIMKELERQGVAVTTLSTSQATLEDVFIHLTGRGLRDG